MNVTKNGMVGRDRKDKRNENDGRVMDGRRKEMEGRYMDARRKKKSGKIYEWQEEEGIGEGAIAGRDRGGRVVDDRKDMDCS